MFSVIIPLHNKEDYIIQCVKSVLNQTFTQFEIIIVNNGSTDRSLQKLDIFNNSSIKIVNTEEKSPGGYAARNLGVKLSKFNYICFLDADDYWEPKFLETMNNLIKKYPAQKVFSVSWKQKSGKTVKYNSFYNKHKRSGTKIIENFFEESAKGRNPICTISICAEKNEFIHSGMFPENRCERGGDIDTWLRLMLRNKLVWSNYLGAVYNKSVKNSVTQLIPDTQIPCVYYDSQQLIKKTDKKTSFLIKKYVNFYAKISVLRSIVYNTNKHNILTGFYKEADIFYYYFFKILTKIPSSVLKPAYVFYRKLMLKFDKNDLG